MIGHLEPSSHGWIAMCTAGAAIGKQAYTDEPPTLENRQPLPTFRRSEKERR